MAARNEAATGAARDVLITRDFDAPRDLVFRAWTDPDRLARWHAPRGCTIEYRAIDVRPGGSFHSCIRAPDGQEVDGAELAMFNEAFSLGGPTCTTSQVEALTGIYIDHYVTLDFAGFKQMVDAVHGPAASAGIRPGDVVLELNDTLLETPDDVQTLEATGGSVIAVLIQRDNARRFVSVHAR